MDKPGDYRLKRASLDAAIRRGTLVRVGVTADEDLIIVRSPDPRLFPPGEDPGRWRLLTLVPFSTPTADIDVSRAGYAWLAARTTWCVGAVTVQLSRSLKPLIGQHLLTLIGTF